MANGGGWSVIVETKQTITGQEARANLAFTRVFKRSPTETEMDQQHPGGYEKIWSDMIENRRYWKMMKTGPQRCEDVM